MKAHRKIVYLKFPVSRSGSPIVCNLARLFDLTFNIIQAEILPRGEGRMTLEISGSEENYTKGMRYLKEQSISVEKVSQSISRDEDLCVHCGVCTAMCHSGALSVNPKTRLVEFDSDKCTGCGMCTRICPVSAMNVQLDR